MPLARHSGFLAGTSRIKHMGKSHAKGNQNNSSLLRYIQWWAGGRATLINKYFSKGGGVSSQPLHGNDQIRLHCGAIFKSHLGPPRTAASPPAGRVCSAPGGWGVCF